MQWAALVGGILVIACQYFASLPFSIYAQSEFWLNSPAQVLIKQGVTLLLASFAFLWTRYAVNGGWSWVRQFGTTSLLVYWVHVELVYGRWLWFLHADCIPAPESLRALTDLDTRAVWGCFRHRIDAPSAALRKPASDDLFGDAFAFFAAVDVGRVEKVDAGFQRLVHDRETVRLRRLRAEVHRAEAQPADFQASAAQLRVLHGFPPFKGKLEIRNTKSETNSNTQF